MKNDYFIPEIEKKIKRFIGSCIPCILANQKRGKQEGFLHPLQKDSIPLHTYHIDHLGPLESTNKNYNHILAVIDAFTKFVWLYPTKSTSTKEVIAKLETQKKNFGNPTNIISDRGTAFTSQAFDEYCKENDIKHFKITTGLPRANGQIERINSIIISVLTKLSLEDPTKWYKHVDNVQQVINSTYQRSIDTTPFELLTGVRMKFQQAKDIQEILEEEIRQDFNEEREELRKTAKKQLFKIQEENRKGYDSKRKSPRRYKVNDLVAIKRTQPGTKLRTKYVGPYRVIRAKNNDTYDVLKEGFHDGPAKTSSCAQYIKPWSTPLEESSSLSELSESDIIQDGRVVGSMATPPDSSALAPGRNEGTRRPGSRKEDGRDTRTAERRAPQE